MAHNKNLDKPKSDRDESESDKSSSSAESSSNYYYDDSTGYEVYKDREDESDADEVGSAITR